MKTSRIFLFAILLIPIIGFAQIEKDVPILLNSPRNTMEVHLFYLQQEHFDPGKASQTIIGAKDSIQANKLAIQLKQILDGKGLWVNLRFIPNDPNFLDTVYNQNIYWPYPKELPTIYLEKIDNKWYYSQETSRSIPEIHKEVYPFGSDILLNLIPKFAQKQILGLALWQYLGLLIILLGGILVYWVINRFITPLISRISHQYIFQSSKSAKLVKQISRFISVLIVLRLIKTFLPTLQLPIDASAFAMSVIKILSIVLIVGIAFRVVEMVVLYAERVTKKTESKLDEQLLPIVTRGIQFLILTGGVIQVFRILNIDITTLIAGLSIGGLAIALAAQDTVKNLFGSVTIFFDKPFQIGDWINFSGVDGTVEEVGFRSTRVRTFANSLVYVPNGKLADMTINNFGLRRYRRFSTKIGLTYNTPPDKIELFIEGLRALVENHPKIKKDNFEVHLNEMSDSSINILFYTFFDVANWSEELKTRHQILINIIKFAEKIGVQFAFPSTSIYVESMPNGGAGDKETKLLGQEERQQFIQSFIQEYKEEVK